MTKVLVYLKTGRVIRLDFADADHAYAYVPEFSKETGVINIQDDYSEYLFYSRDIEFVKFVEEDDE